MTGFSRVAGTSESANWYWEVRSVNARGLDIRVRLAPGTEDLEPKVRAAVKDSFRRGSVSVTLNMQRHESDVEVVLNEEVLKSVLEAASRVEALSGYKQARVDSLLEIKGVLELRDKDESPDDLAARNHKLLAGLHEALRGIVAAREGEGQELQGAIGGHIDEIERLLQKIEGAPARDIECVRARLKNQVEKLLETGQDLDPTRLHQEAALLATRADIEEELKRLRAHIVAARALMKENGAVGRKFDFLAQEFNREANTLCAKSNDIEITQLGLALKAVVDQVREQVQNIE